MNLAESHVTAPGLKAVDILLLRHQGIGAEVGAGAAGEAGQVQGVDRPATAEDAKVEGEHGQAGAKPVHHHCTHGRQCEIAKK